MSASLLFKPIMVGRTKLTNEKPNGEASWDAFIILKNEKGAKICPFSFVLCMEVLYSNVILGAAAVSLWPWGNHSHLDKWQAEKMERILVLMIC